MNPSALWTETEIQQISQHLLAQTSFLSFSATMRLASSCEFCESAVPGLQLLKVLNTTYILICKIWGLNHALYYASCQILLKEYLRWRESCLRKHTHNLSAAVQMQKTELFVNHYKTTENDPAYMHICVRALVRYAHKHSLHERTKHIRTGTVHRLKIIDL